MIEKVAQLTQEEIKEYEALEREAFELEEKANEAHKKVHKELEILIGKYYEPSEFKRLYYPYPTGIIKDGFLVITRGVD